MRVLLGLFLLLALASTPAAAAPPNVTTIIQRMQAALEPVRPSTQKLTIFVHDSQEESTQSVAYQVHKQVWNEDWRLIVLQAPETVKGITYLIQEQVNHPDLQWMYLPAIRRVREFSSVGA